MNDVYLFETEKDQALKFAACTRKENIKKLEYERKKGRWPAHRFRLLENIIHGQSLGHAYTKAVHTQVKNMRFLVENRISPDLVITSPDLRNQVDEAAASIASVLYDFSPPDYTYTFGDIVMFSYMEMDKINRLKQVHRERAAAQKAKTESKWWCVLTTRLILRMFTTVSRPGSGELGARPHYRWTFVLCRYGSAVTRLGDGPPNCDRYSITSLPKFFIYKKLITCKKIHFKINNASTDSEMKASKLHIRLVCEKERRDDYLARVQELYSIEKNLLNSFCVCYRQYQTGSHDYLRYVIHKKISELDLIKREIAVAETYLEYSRKDIRRLRKRLSFFWTSCVKSYPALAAENSGLVLTH